MSENEILARGIVAGMAIVLPFLGITIARWLSWKGCGFDKLGFKNSIDVRDYCDELKRQNEDLLPKCRKANKELADELKRRSDEI